MYSSKYESIYLRKLHKQRLHPLNKLSYVFNKVQTCKNMNLFLMSDYDYRINRITWLFQELLS